ncbi:hypothetical protein [Prevotella melaninogenica]
MKKIFSFALAPSLGVVAPQTVAAKSSSKIEVTEIKHHDGYDEVTFNDESYGFFFEDGTYTTR